MASHHGTTTHAEPAKMEQIITEFFAKSLHIILESRCPFVSSRNYSGEQVLSSPSPSSSSSSSSSFKPRDKWFNLALRDCPAALENIEFWQQSNLEPVIVDVILVQRTNHWDPLSLSPWRKERYSYGSDNDELLYEAKNEKIIERWVLQYESKKSSGNGGGLSGNKRSSCSSSHTLYKKSLLLLRSLYATVRLLPAYKLFRDLISSAQLRLFNLSHRISSFIEPFTLGEEADMQRFVFTPVDTSCGRLCLSVFYHTSMLDAVCSEPSTPISPQFISKYVGSPLAEPLKRFQSGPISRCSRSPSSSPFGRHHSGSYDLYRVSPPSLNPSSSSTYSGSHTSLSKQFSQRFQPAGLPRPLIDGMTAVHMKNPSYDEYWPSPKHPPSPPNCIPYSKVSKKLLRSESAPLNVTASRLYSTPSLPPNQLRPHSPPVNFDPLTPYKQVANSGLYQSSSSVNKSSYSYKDEHGKKIVDKESLNSSASQSFSRSPSRVSFEHDYDDSGFSGAFIVDDDDPMIGGSRPDSIDLQVRPPGPGASPVKRSQDAAVGALVHMLQRAPPLRQDIPLATRPLHCSKIQTPKHCLQKDTSTQVSEDPGVGTCSSTSTIASSEIFTPKTTADALKELLVYTQMKDTLLKQGNYSES